MWKFSPDKPVYTQIIEELKIRIISGKYKCGHKLPSVRDLAAEARVNPNTMQKALCELEKEGYIYSVRTSGKFITDDPEKIIELKKIISKAVAIHCACQLIKLGINRLEAKQLIDNAYEENS